MKGWHKEKPQLHPPIRGWVQDLPGPNDPVGHILLPRKMRINAINDVYLEIPRSDICSRFLWVLGILLFVPLVVCFAYLMLFLLIGPKDGSIGMAGYLIFTGTGLFGILVSGVPVWYYHFHLRYIPRVEALRFNHATQKVYACGSVFHLFPPRIERRYSECSWSDLRAEEFKRRVVMPAGGAVVASQSYFVMYSVVNSDTDVVIERLTPAFKGGNANLIWEAVRRYMQQGPEAIPPANRKIADPNASRNIFMRMALPITWPADLDFLSRSAPGRPARPEDPKYIAQLIATSKRCRRVLYGITFAISAALVWGCWQILPLWK